MADYNQVSQEVPPVCQPDTHGLDEHTVASAASEELRFVRLGPK